MKASKRKQYTVEMTPAGIKYVELKIKEIAEINMDDGNVAFQFKFSNGSTFKEVTTERNYDYWKEVKVGDTVTVCVRGPRMLSIYRC